MQLYYPHRMMEILTDLTDFGKEVLEEKKRVEALTPNNGHTDFRPLA